LIRKARKYLPLFTLGLSTISTQVIYLRKFMDVFYGNELIIGIILTNWMLLTGLGAWLSKRSVVKNNTPPFQVLAFLGLGIIPAMTVAGIVACRIWLFPSGSMVGLYPLLLFSFIIQAPYCLLSGWLFPVLTSQLELHSDFQVSRAYLVESLGSFMAALVFNTLLLFFLPTFAILFLLFLINLFQAWDINKAPKKIFSLYYFGGIFLVFTAVLILLSPDKNLTTLFYRGQKVLESKESPYGNLVVTESSGQKNFYENGLPLFASNDAISREESVHYALLQHPDPKKVLLISGGISGQISEILKYPVEKVDYLEINPWILKLGMTNGLIPGDKRVHILAADARLWLQTTNEQYDAVLIQLPDPVTAQINRYFTHDFFRSLLKNLTHEAVVSISLRSTSDYMNPISREINSLVYNSLLFSFKHVTIVPGSRNYFLASDATLSLKIDSLADLRNINNDYVNSAYLQGDLLTARSKEIQSHLDEKVNLNRDFQPRAYFEETRLWLSAFKSPWWISAAVIMVLLAAYFYRSKRSQVSLFVTGFTASSVSFLLMMAFQSLFGYLYLVSGILISLFMLGLALGCFFHPWLWKKGYSPSPAWYQVYFGGFVILFLMVLLGNNKITDSKEVLMAIFFLISLVNGFLTGLQFSEVTAASEEKPGIVASKIYSADLLGSALGMLLVSAFLFPVAGLVWLCLGLGLINFVVGFIMFE
jgi:spermidine synthase